MNWPTAITIIEPHPDDAFLSLGSHLLYWRKLGIRTRILSVFDARPQRRQEAQEYAALVGADWGGLGLEQDVNAKVGQPEFEWLTSNVIGRVVWPLGISRPDHKELSACTRRNVWIWGVWYYLDTPYYIVQKNYDELTEKSLGLKAVSIMHPAKKKFEAIPIFQSQRRYFYWHSEEQLRQAPEIILSDR